MPELSAESLPLEVELRSPRAASLFPEPARLERVATGFRFTEGPLWDPRTGTLLFSDIPASRIYRWSPGGVTVHREPSWKSNGLTWDRDGALLSCEHVGRRVSRERPDGGVETVVDRYAGRKLNSPNDLVVRSDGALYFSDPPYGIQSPEVGEPAEQEQPLNGLYLLRPGGTEPVLLADDFDRPNGLAFSPDEQRLYVADTPRYHVRVFRVAGDGTLNDSRVFAELPESAGQGRPDGMKTDAAGNLWTTGPGGVWVVAADGEVLAHVRFPEKTANCAWGDPDGKSLFVTASTSVYRLRTS